MTGERWLAIPGWEGRYQVSDFGRVRNTIGHVLSLSRQKSGHLRAALWRNNKVRYEFVHRLVLQAFVGQCPAGEEGCHRNGDPADNALSNLRWGTRQSNILDSVRHGTHAWATKESCPSNHPYNAQNTYVNTAGSRVCRVCKRNSARRNYNSTTRRERYERAKGGS